jgi:DNA modification methylase
MASGLANFFVQFLTERGDLVLDPFAGSNTTGFVSEINERRWLSIEQDLTYAAQSRIRLGDPAFERHDTA